MRIAVIGPTYPYRGGIANFTTLLTKALREEHEVLLISYSRQYPKWLFPGKSDQDPSDNPITTEAEYLIDSINPLTWLRALWRLRQFGPDLVVMQWWVVFWAPLCFVLGWGVRLLRNRPKLAVIVHNAQPHEASTIDKVAIRLGLSAADQLVAQAQSDGTILRQQFASKQVVVTPLPTYAALGDNVLNSAELPFPPDKPLLLFCGLIRPYKGLDILLDAMPHVLAKRDAHLAIVGEMWNGGEDYLTQIERLGLQSHVTLENEYVTNERLAAWIKSAEVVVLPYRTATQSAVLQSAFGLETPVITTAVGGLPDVVDHGRTGLLVPPEDPIALANAILHFFEQQLRLSFVEHIRAQTDRFSWQNYIQHLLS